MQVHHGPHWISYAVTAAVILIVMALRFRQVGKVRRLRLETLWIIPALYAGVAAYIFWTLPPHGVTWLWCALALVAGGALGWKRGGLMAISVDPQTHSLNQKTSLASMIFIIVLVVVRTASRELAMEMGLTAHGGIALLTDILVACALGLLTLQRIEMFLRARRLLAAARASR